MCRDQKATEAHLESLYVHADLFEYQVSFVVLLGHTRTSWASWTSDVYLCSSGGHHLEKRAINFH